MPEDPYSALKRLLTQYRSSGDEYNTPVPPPSPVRGREPQVVGPPELGKMAQQFYRMAPTLRETVKDIRVGPTPGSSLFTPAQGADYIWGTGGLLPSLALTNISEPQASIGMSPRVMKDTPEMQERVLSHELAHTAGWRHETPGSAPQNLLDMLRGRKLYGE